MQCHFPKFPMADPAQMFNDTINLLSVCNQQELYDSKQPPITIHRMGRMVKLSCFLSPADSEPFATEYDVMYAINTHNYQFLATQYLNRLWLDRSIELLIKCAIQGPQQWHPSALIEMYLWMRARSCSDANGFESVLENTNNTDDFIRFFRAWAYKKTVHKMVRALERIKQSRTRNNRVAIHDSCFDINTYATIDQTSFESLVREGAQDGFSLTIVHASSMFFHLSSDPNQPYTRRILESAFLTEQYSIAESANGIGYDWNSFCIAEGDGHTLMTFLLSRCGFVDDRIICNGCLWLIAHGACDMAANRAGTTPVEMIGRGLMDFDNVIHQRFVNLATIAFRIRFILFAFSIERDNQMELGCKMEFVHESGFGLNAT